MGPRRAVVERDVEEDSSSSESEAEWEDEEVMEEAKAPDQRGDGAKQPGTGPRGKITIALKNNSNSSSLVCKVCGKSGHLAGFVGSVYLDCPNRPCYLCKKTGHTTATCPYKVAPGQGTDHSPASSSHSSQRQFNIASSVMARALGQGSRSPRPSLQTLPRYQIEAAIYKLFTRRICCLEFHPQLDNFVICGDKKGHLGIWNYIKVHDHTVYSDVHQANLNQIRVLPWADSMSCCTAAADGTVKVFDLETGANRSLLNLNPGGWVQGGPWTMAYCCAPSSALNVIVAGDSDGAVHILDPRVGGSDAVGIPGRSDRGSSSSSSAAGGSSRSAEVLKAQVHRKDKIVSLDIHPVEQTLMLTAGNDRIARLSDLRMLSSSGGSPSNVAATSSGSKKEMATAAAAAYTVANKAELAAMPHPRVVSSAYFSPVTGNKILTTCQDNRIRIWDSLLTAGREGASREIVHSHDFNRYLTAFRAEWDPKDATENIFVLGRYISEDFNGQALHPIDIYHATSGRLLQELVDKNLTTITPVNKPHPRRDVIISGSSRSLYAWTPDTSDDEGAGEEVMEECGDKAVGGKAGAATSAAEHALGMKRHSSNFLFFDADPASDSKKKKKSDGKKKTQGDDSEDE